MIAASELRIGNLVQRPKNLRIPILDGNQLYYKVDTVMIRDCEYYGDKWAFEPIPLTPEILEKAGFKDKKYKPLFKMVSAPVHYERNIIIICQDERYSLNCYEDTEIKYLHTLQNLYFALTGQELKISL